MVLCLQCQTLAAMALPCAHGGGDSPPGLAVCNHGQDDAPLSAATHFACAKCALTSLCSLDDVPAQPIMQPALFQRSGPPGGPQPHFFSFIPDQPRRPPISQPG